MVLKIHFKSLRYTAIVRIRKNLSNFPFKRHEAIRRIWMTLLAKPYPDVQKLPRKAGSSFFIFEFSFSLLSYFRYQIHGKTWFIIFCAWLKNYVKCLNLQSLCWLFLYLNVLERTFWIDFWIYHGGSPVCKISFLI